jgi:hypothetical protein
MSSLTERLPSLPQTGGKTAIVLFILTLIAFVVESQLTQVRVSFYSSFKRFLHLTFSLSIKKSMYKARFIIASRSSSCTSIQENVPSVEDPLSHASSPAVTLSTPRLPPSSHCIYYTSSSQRLHLWNLS